MVVQALSNFIHPKGLAQVIDLDFSNYFGTIEHKKLIALLEMRIKDKRFIRYIARMLKSGIMEDGAIVRSDEGMAQGSICSPLLANIYGHYCLDIWFEDEIKPKLVGQACMARYCDDVVICASNTKDSKFIWEELQGRIKRFGLKMNVEKTRRTSLDKRDFIRTGQAASFKCLGFMFYLAKSRKGMVIAKIRTDPKSWSKKIKDVTNWIKCNRHKYSMTQLWKRLTSKIVGHANYYSVSHNLGYVVQFSRSCVRIFFKWINRRGQRKSMNWDKFTKFKEAHPILGLTVKHPLFWV